MAFGSEGRCKFEAVTEQIPDITPSGSFDHKPQNVFKQWLAPLLALEQQFLFA